MSTQRGGYVLVSVLWVVALLTVVTLSYHHRARLEVQAARYSLDASQCRMAARGVVERGIVELLNKEFHDRAAALVQPGTTAPVTHLGQPWARPIDLYADGGLLAPGAGFENDSAMLRIEDLDRYIDLNHAGIEVLEALPGLSLPVVRRLHARRSGTDETGAAADPGPVAFHDTAELRYFRGIDEDDWYGNKTEPGLRDLLTTVGDGRVNVNTAPPAVLQVLPDVGAKAAEDILAYRNGEDGISNTPDDRGFSGWEEFSALTQLTGDTLQSLQRLCKFDSEFFKITGVATRRGGRIRASCAAVVRIPEGATAANVVSWREESLGSE
jgi:type II secretory pathway component PulK